MHDLHVLGSGGAPRSSCLRLKVGQERPRDIVFETFPAPPAIGEADSCARRSGVSRNSGSREALLLNALSERRRCRHSRSGLWVPSAAQLPFCLPPIPLAPRASPGAFRPAAAATRRPQLRISLSLRSTLLPPLPRTARRAKPKPNVPADAAPAMPTEAKPARLTPDAEPLRTS